MFRHGRSTPLSSFWLTLRVNTAGSVEACLRKFLGEDLKQFGVTLEHFHSDGGAELVSAKKLSLLHSKSISTSHSPRDTPEMKSTVERRVRDVKERTLSMLLHSAVPFWWLALRAAVYIQNRMPTRTTEGYMTPFECLRKSPPNLRQLRIWRCRAYVIKPKADRHKYFNAEAYSEIFVGYGEQKMGSYQTRTR